MAETLKNRHIVVRNKEEGRLIAIVDIESDSAAYDLPIEKIHEFVQPNYQIPIELEETEVNG